MSYSSLGAQLWHALTTDDRVLPATHTFIHKWNELLMKYTNMYICNIAHINNQYSNLTLFNMSYLLKISINNLTYNTYSSWHK